MSFIVFIAIKNISIPICVIASKRKHIKFQSLVYQETFLNAVLLVSVSNRVDICKVLRQKAGY
jgi:hypothetical protein